MDALLGPPANYNGHDLSVLEFSKARWYRVHQCHHSALYFDRTPTYRFNAPAGQFGILYISEAPEGAFAEALLGSRARPPTLTESQLKARALTAFDWRGLRLADFTGPGLVQLGLDARISTGEDYALSRNWASWIHGHPGNVDGICYLARNAPSTRSVALFDRAGTPDGATLLEPAFMPSTGSLAPYAAKFVDLYKVAIL